MVLCLYRQALIPGIHGRAFGNGKRLEDTIHLQAQVIVQSARAVLLDHKILAWRADSFFRRRGLGCDIKISLIPIGFQRV
jgi:hypothetical protein